MALRGREIDGYLAKPDPSRPIILLYGPDTGLVHERADALAASAVDDPSDPFSLIRLDGDELAAEPSRLVDEAMTIPLFGGRRAIRIRAGGKNFSSGIDTLAQMQLKDCRIVIEAGELRPDAPLRKACERAKTAVAIACYPDTERDLTRLVDDELRTFDLRISQDARTTLVQLLGGDRQASRNEIRKLALYARGEREVTVDHVMAIVTDASGLALDAIIDSAFSGRPADVETVFTKAIASGVYPGAVMVTAQRHAAQLHKTRLSVDDGQSISSAVESGFPRLHFSRKAAVEIALQNATIERLLKTIAQLAEAAFEMRKQSDLAVAIAQRALMSVAVNTRRRG